MIIMRAYTDDYANELHYRCDMCVKVGVPIVSSIPYVGMLQGRSFKADHQPPGPGGQASQMTSVPTR